MIVPTQAIVQVQVLLRTEWNNYYISDTDQLKVWVQKKQLFICLYSKMAL